MIDRIAGETDRATEYFDAVAKGISDRVVVDGGNRAVRDSTARTAISGCRATAAQDRVVRNQYGFAGISSTAKLAHPDAILRGGVRHQIALQDRIFAAGNADSVGRITTEGSVIENLGVIHVVRCASAVLGIESNAIISIAPDKVIGDSQALSRLQGIRGRAIVHVDAIPPTAADAAIPNGSIRATEPLCVAVMHPDTVNIPSSYAFR